VILQVFMTFSTLVLKMVHIFVLLLNVHVIEAPSRMNVGKAAKPNGVTSEMWIWQRWQMIIFS